jgi:DNA repair exonuclease SbcCD ATPase subunit
MAEWNDLPTIIGLDYEQFLRTVLIAQGSFANFLKAKEDERYELLEKLVGCEEMYTRIAREIKNKKDAAVEAYNMINASVDAVKQYYLSDEELARLEEEIRQLEKAEQELAATIKNVENQLKWYDDEEKMTADILNCQTAVNQAQQSLEEFQTSIYLLNLRDALTPAIDHLRDVKKTEATILETEKSIEKDKQKSKQQEELIIAAYALLAQLKEAAEKAQNVIDETTPHIKKARELMTRIETAKATCIDKKKVRTTAEKEKDDAENAVKANQSKIEKAQETADKATADHQTMMEEVEKKKEELKKAAEETTKALNAEIQKVEGLNAEELQSQKAKADTAWQILVDALKVVGLSDNTSKEKIKSERRKEELEKRNTHLSEELAKLQIDALRSELDKLQNCYTLMTSKEWGLHRRLLETGKPCPLCGATEHPYHENEAFFDKATSDFYHLIETKKSTLNSQVQDEKKWLGELQKNEGELNGLERLLLQLKGNLELYESDWKRLSEQNPHLKKNKVELESILPSYEEKKKEAEAQLKFFNQVQKGIARLTKEKDKAVEEQGKYAETADDHLAKALEKVNTAKTRLAEAKAVTPTLLEQQEEKRKALEEATKAWEQADEALKQLQTAYRNELGDENPDAVEKRLNKSKEDADAEVNKKNDEISKMQTALGEIRGALQTHTQQLEEEKRSLDRKKAELTEWIAQYNSKEDKIKEISLEDVETMYLASEDWNAIRQEKDLRTQNVVSATTLLQNAKETHDKHQTAKPEKERDMLHAELQKLQDDSHNDEFVAAKTKMNNHIEACRQLGDKMGELNQARSIKDDWTAITDAIGAEGKTLRKIAQCYTLSFLIEHANVEIRKFNSRYELQQVKNSLGIRVIDHDRADDVRDTTTLSGGETFIVSLGLALGLSSLSSRNISFENLFIDEGFGTLDLDMLPTVIDSLAMLQSSQGKKVGVISHTSIMSERITTQIRIVKDGNSGSSHIEFYP